MRFVIIFSLCLLVSKVAFGTEYFVEPSLNFGVGKLEWPGRAEVSSVNFGFDSNGDTKEYGAGLGLGLNKDKFFAGIDARYSILESSDLKVSAPSIGFTSALGALDGNVLLAGVWIGLQIIEDQPLIVRVGYYPLAQLKEKDSDGSEYSGTAMRGGLSYRLESDFTLNLDYILTEYNKVKDSSGTMKLPGEMDFGGGDSLKLEKLKQSTILFSIGYRFDIDS